MEDTSFKNRMNQVIVNMSSETARELSKYDDEVRLHSLALHRRYFIDLLLSLRITCFQCALLAAQIHNSQLKRTFLNDFADNPAEFIQTWLESQSRDLESVLGSGPSEGHTVREEELKRSEFFRLPWVEEAVAIQEGMRLASKSSMSL